MSALPFIPRPATLTHRVLFMDDFLLLVEKPSGLLSVPGRGEDKQDCLIARVMVSTPNARIVHRLDRDTSGLLLLARDADTHRELSRQFQDREVGKKYIALAVGFIAENAGSIDLPLRYDPPTKPRHVIDIEGGQSALTHWQVIERAHGVSRVSLIPHTGRTHQLRVHMQALGHPLLGDSLYAPADACADNSRLCLHAEHLSFTHPHTHEKLSFHCPAPF